MTKLMNLAYRPSPSPHPPLSESEVQTQILTELSLLLSKNFEYRDYDVKFTHLAGQDKQEVKFFQGGEHCFTVIAEAFESRRWHLTMGTCNDGASKQIVVTHGSYRMSPTPALPSAPQVKKEHEGEEEAIIAMNEGKMANRATAAGDENASSDRQSVDAATNQTSEDVMIKAEEGSKKSKKAKKNKKSKENKKNKNKMKKSMATATPESSGDFNASNTHDGANQATNEMDGEKFETIGEYLVRTRKEQGLPPVKPKSAARICRSDFPETIDWKNLSDEDYDKLLKLIKDPMAHADEYMRSQRDNDQPDYSKLELMDEVGGEDGFDKGQMRVHKDHPAVAEYRAPFEPLKLLPETKVPPRKAVPKKHWKRFCEWAIAHKAECLTHLKHREVERWILDRYFVDWLREVKGVRLQLGAECSRMYHLDKDDDVIWDNQLLMMYWELPNAKKDNDDEGAGGAGPAQEINREESTNMSSVPNNISAPLSTIAGGIEDGKDEEAIDAGQAREYSYEEWMSMTAPLSTIGENDDEEDEGVEDEEDGMADDEGQAQDNSPEENMSVCSTLSDISSPPPANDDEEIEDEEVEDEEVQDEEMIAVDE
ncbi:MAG: hypothetical protein Q9218_007812 [Villophora microphyllina]